MVDKLAANDGIINLFSCEISIADMSDEELIREMVKTPVLIQRPIVIANGQARIGRPPENVLEIL